MGTGFLGRTDQHGEAVSCLLCESSGNVCSSAIGWVMSLSRAYGSGLEINMGNVVVGVRCSPSDQEEVGEVLMGDFNHPNVCWRDKRVGYKQSRRFLDILFLK